MTQAPATPDQDEAPLLRDCLALHTGALRIEVSSTLVLERGEAGSLTVKPCARIYARKSNQGPWTLVALTKSGRKGVTTILGDSWEELLTGIGHTLDEIGGSR